MESCVNRALDDIVFYITSSDDYKMCLSIKEKMRHNSNIIKLISDIKKVQKEYVQSGFSEDKKDIINKLNKELNEIPIYIIYMKHLNKVNEMINFVKDELNEYFYKLLNENTEI